MNATSQPPAAYMTPPDVATILKISPEKVIRWIVAGKLRGINVSSGASPRWRISPDDLRRYLDSLTPAAYLAGARPKRRRPKVAGEVDYLSDIS